MPIVAPYRESPAEPGQGAARPPTGALSGLLLAFVVTALLAAPVLALALQPFSDVATLVAAALAALAAVTYSRICLSR